MTRRESIDETLTIRGARHTVITEAEPLELELDPDVLGQPVAIALRDAAARGIRGITQMSRDGKHRLFNRTGALVSGLHVERGRDGELAIAAPSDHFQHDEDGALMSRLVDLVPAIANPFTDPAVESALEQAAELAVTKRPG